MWLTYPTDISLFFSIIPDHFTRVPSWQAFKNMAVVDIRFMHHISTCTILCTVPTDNPNATGKSGIVVHLFSQDRLSHLCSLQMHNWCVGPTDTITSWVSVWPFLNPLRHGLSQRTLIMLSTYISIKLCHISIGKSCFAHTKWNTLKTSSCYFPMPLLFQMNLSPK